MINGNQATRGRTGPNADEQTQEVRSGPKVANGKKDTEDEVIVTPKAPDEQRLLRRRLLPLPQNGVQPRVLLGRPR